MSDRSLSSSRDNNKSGEQSLSTPTSMDGDMPSQRLEVVGNGFSEDGNSSTLALPSITQPDPWSPPLSPRADGSFARGFVSTSQDAPTLSSAPASRPLPFRTLTTESLTADHRRPRSLQRSLYERRRTQEAARSGPSSIPLALPDKSNSASETLQDPVSPQHECRGSIAGHSLGVPVSPTHPRRGSVLPGGQESPKSSRQNASVVPRPSISIIQEDHSSKDETFTPYSPQSTSTNGESSPRKARTISFCEASASISRRNSERKGSVQRPSPSPLDRPGRNLRLDSSAADPVGSSGPQSPFSTMSVPTLGVADLTARRSIFYNNRLARSFSATGLEGESRRKSSFRGSIRPSAFAARKSFSGFQDYVERRRSVSADPATQYRRRRSASSAWFFMQRNPTKVPTLPFLDNDNNPELVEQFMEMTRKDKESWKKSKFQVLAFKSVSYFAFICVLYFFLVGKPLWNGVILELWHFIHLSPLRLGCLLFFSYGASISLVPILFTRFEDEVDDVETRDSSETCLIVPAYKAAGALPETIEHALKIFSPRNIFIIANGNSPVPQDNTEEVCDRYGVNFFWVPVGSKIVAEFVGVVLAKDFKYSMLIDDDVHLPPNLPIVTDRLNERTACIGYTIKSTGANGAKGTIIQQCQDVEYKLSGLSRTFGGKYGSTTFPHGAIILWERQTLENLFWSHPGYHISEDWYFGHVCRSVGKRIQFCSQVFVETETPPSLFFPEKSTRGGYGEMTIFKQRFYRWNFFYVYRLYDNFLYLAFAWRLGWLEIATKLMIIQEVYAVLMYIIRPIAFPIALMVNAKLAIGLMFALTFLYAICFAIFNTYHLRRKNEMIAWKIMPYYFAMKLALSVANTASVYYSIYKYAEFFATKHPRVTQDHNALNAAQELIKKHKAAMNPQPDIPLIVIDDLLPLVDTVPSTGHVTYTPVPGSPDLFKDFSGEYNPFMTPPGSPSTVLSTPSIGSPDSFFGEKSPFLDRLALNNIPEIILDELAEVPKPSPVFAGYNAKRFSKKKPTPSRLVFSNTPSEDTSPETLVTEKPFQDPYVPSPTDRCNTSIAIPQDPAELTHWPEAAASSAVQDLEMSFVRRRSSIAQIHGVTAGGHGQLA